MSKIIKYITTMSFLLMFNIFSYAENQTAQTLESMMSDFSPTEIANFQYGRVREELEAANRIVGGQLFKEEASKYGLDVYTNVRERAAQQ